VHNSNSPVKPNEKRSQSPRAIAIFAGFCVLCLDASSIAIAESDTDKVEDLATDQAAGFASNRTKQFLDPYFDHLELNISGGQKRKPDINFIGVSAYDDDGEKDSFLFNQFGINRFDGRTTLNLGLGYRVVTSDDKLMVGGNIFYDHELPDDHQRAGAGIEARSSIFRFTANTYSGMSGYKADRSGTDSKPLDGNDLKVEVSLPYLPGSKLTYTDFKWKGIDGASDSEGYTVGVKGYLTNNLLLEVGRTDFTGTSNASSRNMISLSYHFRFNDEETDRFYQVSSHAYEMKPLGQLRYEPVDRENRIIKQKKFATTVSGV